MARPTVGNEKDRLLDHEYDGIAEYDNPLPSWWVWIFWATIIFSAGYVVYYQLGPGPSVLAEYESEVKVAAERAPKTAAVAVSDEAIVALRKDAQAMAHAKEVFATRCAPCHGPQGQGVVGPNLTDEYWLHGGKPGDIVRTISEGVPDKGMIPWKGQLQPAEIQGLAAWIGTLRGSNPPNPKPPQGEKVAEGS